MLILTGDISLCSAFHSIARSASAWRARAPTSVFSGGPSLRRSSSSSQEFGRWSISKVSLRPRNWFNNPNMSRHCTWSGAVARPPTAQKHPGDTWSWYQLEMVLSYFSTCARSFFVLVYVLVALCCVFWIILFNTSHFVWCDEAGGEWPKQ